MPIDIKFTKAQISKMIQSSGFLRNMLGNLGKKVITDLAVPLARDDLSELVSNLETNAINKLKRKISGKRAVRTGQGFTLFIMNEEINDIIKIIKSLEYSNILIDDITEIVKYETKSKKEDFLLLC